MYVSLTMTIPILPLFTRELGGSVAMVGIIMAIRGIGPLVLNIPSGLIISKFGNRRTLMLSVLVTLFAAIGARFVQSVAQLAVLSFFMGAMRSTWNMACVGYVRAVVPAHQRGRAISAIGGINRIGGFVGPIVGGILGKHFGLAPVFLGQAAVAGATILILLLQHRESVQSEMNDAPNKTFTATSVLKVFLAHRKSFATAGLVTVSFQLIRAARLVIFPLWGDNIGLDVAQIGLIVGLISAIDMTLFYPAGTVMDKKGRKWTAVPSLLIMSLSFVLMPLANSFAVLLALGLLNGFGNGLGSGIVMTMGSDLAPEDHTGEFLGIWFVVAALGGSTGPLIIGALSELLTLGAASIASGGLGALGGLFLLFFVTDTYRGANQKRSDQ